MGMSTQHSLLLSLLESCLKDMHVQVDIVNWV